MPAPTSRGSAIRAARRAAGLTMRALADRADVSRATLTRWEAGRVVPTGSRLDAVVAVIRAADPEQGRGLARALGLPSREPAMDPSAIELLIYRAADDVDVPAAHLRSAIEAIARPLREAGGTLEDLERACRARAAKASRAPRRADR